MNVPKYDNSPQVNETALGEEDDVTTIWHGETVDLGLDVGDGNSIGLEPGDIDFNVEVADAEKLLVSKTTGQKTEKLDALRNDCIFGHDREVLASDDIPVTSGGNEDVGTRGSILHGSDFVASHGSLEGIDGIDFGDQNTSAIRFQGFGAL